MFTLSYCIFEVPTGTLGDRIGPRRVLTRVGIVVVRVHVADWPRFELSSSVAHQVLLWCWRSRGIPKRIHRRLALVPEDAARQYFRSHADGEPNWRRCGSVAGGTDPDSAMGGGHRSTYSE
jgi:hypothetical protein